MADMDNKKSCAKCRKLMDACEECNCNDIPTDNLQSNIEYIGNNTYKIGETSDKGIQFYLWTLRPFSDLKWAN